MQAKNTFTVNPRLLWGDFKGAFQMFWAVLRGKYPPPIKSILWSIAGFLYFIIPIDAVPESVLLFLGLGDDLLVIVYVLNKIRPDIEAYKKFVVKQEGKRK